MLVSDVVFLIISFTSRNTLQLSSFMGPTCCHSLSAMLLLQPMKFAVT